MRRLLVFGPSWLGDAVMAIPVLRGLRRAFPDAHIAVVAREAVAGLYPCVPEVDQVVVYRRPRGPRRLLGYAELVGRCSRVHADTALILPRSFGSAWTALLADVSRRIGYAASGRGPLLTHPVPREPGLLRTHRVHYFQHLLRPLGVDPEPEPPRLLPTERGEREAERLLAPLTRGGSGPLIALNPGANYGSAKQWPEIRYASLGRALRREFDARLVLVGASGDRDVCDRIRHEIDAGHVLDLSGATDLQALVSVLRRADLMVTNDTGAMHVGAAVGLRQIAVFGPTDPVTTAPYGPGHAVVREPVDCSPCLLRTCPIDHRCMRRIDPERVLAACADLLAARFAS